MIHSLAENKLNLSLYLIRDRHPLKSKSLKRQEFIVSQAFRRSERE